MKTSDSKLHQLGTNGNSEPKGNNDDEEGKGLVSWVTQLRTAIAFLTIEPFLVCYVFPIALSSIAVNRLIKDKACIADLNYTREICDEENVTVQVQSIVADMTTWQIPLQSSVPAIAILFVGAWSDRTGNRKALMMIPMLGEMLSSFGLLLSTHFLKEWSLFITALVATLPTAFSGGATIALMGSYSYLADVTSAESRTFRIGIAVIILTLGVPVGSSVSGILLNAIGYQGMFGITTILYLLGLLYTYFRVHDLKRVKIEGTFCKKLADFFNPRNPLDTLNIVLKKSSIRVKIILVIVAHVVIVGPAVGESSMQYQFLILKYKMNDVEITLFSTYSTILGICGTAIAVTLFSKYLKMHDAIIGIIATACKVVSSCVYGLAPTRAWLYSGPVFDLFGGTGVTAIRSLGTKVVEPEQVAKICSLIGLVEALVPVIYVPMYTQMYKNTIEILPGAIFLIGAAMTVPAFCVFITLYILHKKEEKDKVKNPENKERYAHDNDVTAL